MPELKTKPTVASVAAFLDAIPDANQRRDSKKVAAMMKKITGQKPVLWGPSIVGFGTYHYKYASGHEGDCAITGFSPRKGTLTLYIMGGFAQSAALLKKLGKHKTGKCCLYIKSLDDIHMPTLEKLVRASVDSVRARGSDAVGCGG